MSTQLTTIIEESGLETNQAESILTKFQDFFNQASEWEATAKSLVVTDVNDKEGMKKAREGRLALKKIRVDAENTRKELKERSLREGKAIDGIANVIKALVVPIEEHLEKQEKFAEVQEELRKEKVLTERVSQLQQYVLDTNLYNLKEMSEEGFQELLKTSKFAFDAQQEAERKAEADRIAAEKAKEEEDRKIREENERLKAEAEERDRQAAEEEKKREKERLAREKAEAEEKARQQAILDEEKRKREEAEAELKRKADEEENARREKEKVEADAKRLESEKKAEQEKLEKTKAYTAFLKSHGYTKETSADFKTEETDEGYVLYKKVGIFKK